MCCNVSESIRPSVRTFKKIRKKYESFFLNFLEKILGKTFSRQKNQKKIFVENIILFCTIFENLFF